MGDRVKSRSYGLVFCAVIALGTTACLDKKSKIKPPGTSSSSGSSSVGFTGATSAQNLAVDGLSIEIKWTAASAPYSYYMIYLMAANGTLTAVNPMKLPLSKTSYVQGGLTSGNIYNFIVRAFREDGTSDENTTVVSAMAYSGIKTVGGATGVSLNSAFINFPAVGTQAVGAQINCRNPNGTVSASMSVYDTAATSQALTGLYSGTTYACTVNAIYSGMSGVLQNDSNATAFTFQTISQSYTQTTPAYQGVILVQAFGDAPTAPIPATAPAAIPSPVPVLSTRQVNITWKNFTGVDPWTSQYRLVRVRQGGVLDMNTTASCTSATTTSCQICVSTSGTNPISRTCSDTVVSLGKSPNRYEYAVSLIVNSASIPPLAEEMPKTSSDAPFRILVPIPPDHMVLVHRDSVNYEKCSNMGLTMDPLNNQRCSYTGLGVIPYSTSAFGMATPITLKGNAGTPYAGVTNAGTFYDFGYNLFVDRWETGCNWTPSAATSPGGTGMCGPAATPGNCFGSTGPPLNSIGVNGNVYFDTSMNNCYSKYSGVWVAVPSMGAAPESAKIGVATIVPSTTVQKPPMSFKYEVNPTFLCQAQLDPNYGPKRPLTRREQMGASAFQTLPGEPSQMGNTEVSSLQNGISHPTTQACNSNNHNGVAAPAALNINQAGTVGGNMNYAFMIGSHYTAACVSRFGAQDMVGNMSEFLGDTFSCVGTNCTANSKDYKFLQSYNFDGVASNTGPGGTGNGQVSPTWTTAWSLWQQWFGATYYSAPMGLPFLSSDFGNAVPVSTLKSNVSAAYIGIVIQAGVVNRLMNAGGSFYNPYGYTPNTFSIYVNPGPGYSWYGYRCALPAE